MSQIQNHNPQVLCARQVRHVLALVHTVTGAKLNAFFKYDEDDTSTYTARGKRYEHGLPWQRMNGPGHVFRRWIIRCECRVTSMFSMQ